MGSEEFVPNKSGQEFETHSPEDTLALAHLLGSRLEGGEVIALTGTLGAGKTLFVKGIAKGLGIDPREVTSPTFLLVHELCGRLGLKHLDAYRSGGAQEILELGYDDFAGAEAVVVIEWAERVSSLLPTDHLRLTLLISGESSRRLEFCATGPRHADLLQRTFRAGSAEGHGQ